MDSATAPTPLRCSFDDLVSAVSNPTRLRILRELLKEPLPSRVLAARLRQQQYNIAKHLHILREAGILAEGYGRVYRIAEDLRKDGGSTVDLGVMVLRPDRIPG